MNIREEISEIFNEYTCTPTGISETAKHFGGLEFTMVWMSPDYNSDYEKDKYERIKSFYEVLSETKDLVKARKESGFNISEARHYINFFNNSFKSNGKALLYEKKICRRLRKNKRIESEESLFERLENI